MGAVDGALTIVVFSDFQCPACASFANDFVPAITARYPGNVGIVYKHWPLDSGYSYEAARFAECAAREGLFPSFHRLMFLNQDSIGRKSFRDLALEAGVADLPRFDSCTREPGVVQRIAEDIAEARALGGTGTPTVIMNGFLVKGAAGRSVFDSIADALMGPE